MKKQKHERVSIPYYTTHTDELSSSMDYPYVVINALDLAIAKSTSIHDAIHLSHFESHPFLVRVGNRGGVNSYVCMLCSVEIPNDEALHMHNIVHSDRIKKLHGDFERTKGIVHRFKNIYSDSTAKGALERLERLETPAWRDAVQAALFRYLISHDKKLDLLDSAVQELQRYEHSEQMAVLHLAVWKAVCLLQMPEKVDYYLAQEWVRSGWKSCKAEQRNSSAMSILLSSVLPFVEASDN
jgi:hypothetical protein